MTTVYFDSQHDDEQRRQNLYEGDIYVYSPTKASLGICDFAQHMCTEAFGGTEPPTAHRSHTVEQYTEILKTLKPGFIHHPRCKELLPELLTELGCPRDETYFDVPRLRTACPQDYLTSGMAYAFKPHRDSWYSTPYSQLNWWIPVYPITADNCMAFHLNFWKKPVTNTSAGFNYQDWNQVGRKQASAQGKVDKRVQSEVVGELDLEPQIRLVGEPGSIIVFSAAHLHSTVPNSTESTRISIDFRTVNRDDLENGRGAPNLDDESTGTTTCDYLRCSDLQHLPDSLIESHKSSLPSPAVPHPTTPGHRSSPGGRSPCPSPPRAP